MSQQFITFSRTTSAPASTSPLAIPSPDTTIVTSTVLEAFQLEPILWGFERGYRCYQPARYPHNTETFQLAREWSEFPNAANSWLGPSQFPTNGSGIGDDSLGHDRYCLDTAESWSPGVIDISEPPSLSFGRPEIINNGNYRCYQRGCEGRRFSSSENYRRHIRERNGSDRTTCPFCSADFTRKSNKDAHVRKGRCKGISRWFSKHISISSNGGISREGTYIPPPMEKR